MTSDEISLGTWSLRGGTDNVFRLVAAKAGPSGLSIGVDYLKLKLVLVEDAIEAEGLKILKQENAQAQHQELGDQWSAGTQLFCPGAQNQFVDLGLPARKAGRYALAIHFTKAADYGIVEVELDGKAVGQKFNGYNDGVVPSGKVDFGTVELGEGAHVLTFRVREKEQRSSDFFMGIDCLTLTRAP